MLDGSTVDDIVKAHAVNDYSDFPLNSMDNTFSCIIRASLFPRLMRSVV